MKKYQPVFQLAEQSVQPASCEGTNGKIDSASLNAMMEQMKPSETFLDVLWSGIYDPVSG